MQMNGFTYLTGDERIEKALEEITDALKREDWETVSDFIILNAEIMEFALKMVYPRLPDSYKYSLPVECYTNHGDSMPTVRKYVHQAWKYETLENRVPADLIAQQEVTIYRAGEEPLEKAKYRISWTTSLKVAQWFYDRAKFLHLPYHLYKGVIVPEKIICYTDDRQEQEVMQYNNVHKIVEIER